MNTLANKRAGETIHLQPLIDTYGQGARVHVHSLVDAGNLRPIGDPKEGLFVVVKATKQELVPPSRVSKMDGVWLPPPERFREGAEQAFACGSVIAGEVVPYKTVVK